MNELSLSAGNNGFSNEHNHTTATSAAAENQHDISLLRRPTTILLTY